MERLQKIISAAGVASRRKAEELITSGLVQVNGQTVTELGAKADAGKDHIRVNGKLLKFSGHHVYILLNKPKGYVTTLSDPEGRPTIVDLLHGVKQRVYPVGRLDYASEGLLLLTNDGELANALTKAASHVPKTYLVKVSGQPSDAAIEQLRAGIELPDRKGIHSRTAPAGIQLVHKSENPWYEVTLIEGRNRQIRAMFEQTGHHVEKLKRVRYGPFTLDVHPGKHRNLSPEEVEQLRSAIHRGASATAEASVRPAERAESHIEAELREEARSPVKYQAVSPHTEKPKRAPKPLGTFAAKPRFGAPRPEFSRPGNDRSENKNPGGFRRDEFRKKGPHTVKFGRGDAPFQKPARETGPRPVRPASMGARPDWKKSSVPRRSGPGTGAPRKWGTGASTQASSRTTGPRSFDNRSPRPIRSARPGARPDWKKFAPRSGPPRLAGERTGAPKTWTARVSSPTSRPRLFDKGESRPVRTTGAAGRPDWKKPVAPRDIAPGAPKPSLSKPSAPKKWTQGAPSAASRPRTFEKNLASLGARPDRPSRPRREDSRDGDRPSRPGIRPAGPGEQKPFWQGAGKRRPRKPKDEGDFERRPAKSPNRDIPQGKAQGKGRPRRPVGASSSRPKFGRSKPGKNRS